MCAPLSATSLKPLCFFWPHRRLICKPLWHEQETLLSHLQGNPFPPRLCKNRKKRKKPCKSWKTTNEGIVKHRRCRSGSCIAAVCGETEQPGAEMAGCCASLCELPLKLTVLSFLMRSVFFFLYPVFLPTAVIVSLVCSPGVTCIWKCHGAAFLIYRRGGSFLQYACLVNHHSSLLILYTFWGF